MINRTSTMSVLNEQFRHMRETQISDSNERTATLLARGCVDKRQVSLACEGARPSSQLSRHSWNKKEKKAGLMRTGDE